MLLRLLSLLILILHTAAADDSSFFNTASDSSSISGLDCNLIESSKKVLDILSNNDRLEKVSELQLDE